MRADLLSLDFLSFQPQLNTYYYSSTSKEKRTVCVCFVQLYIITRGRTECAACSNRPRALEGIKDKIRI